MFRCIGLLAFILLLTVIGSALGERQKPGTTLDNVKPGSLTKRSVREAGPSDSRISLVRLREPRKIRKLYEQAMNAWAKDKPAEAERKLMQALKIYPAFPEGLTLYGGIQLTLGQREAAEQNLQAAIQNDPTYCPAYILSAGLYNEEGRFILALNATQQALSCGANTSDVSYEMARSLIGQQDFGRALTITQAALHAEHGSLLHLARAHALVGLKRYRQAMAELRTYLRYQPQGAGSQNAREMLVQIESAIGE